KLRPPAKNHHPKFHIGTQARQQNRRYRTIEETDIPLRRKSHQDHRRTISQARPRTKRHHHTNHPRNPTIPITPLTPKNMIIQSLFIAQLHDIISYSPFPSGSGQIEVANWTAVPMHPASGEMTISDSHTPAGRSFRTMLSCRLRQSFSIPRACILKVVLCNGGELLIGSPDIPVQPNKNSSLYLDTFTINHETFHPPLPL